MRFCGATPSQVVGRERGRAAAARVIDGPLYPFARGPHARAMSWAALPCHVAPVAVAHRWLAMLVPSLPSRDEARPHLPVPAPRPSLVSGESFAVQQTTNDVTAVGVERAAALRTLGLQRRREGGRHSVVLGGLLGGPVAGRRDRRGR